MIQGVRHKAIYSIEALKVIALKSYMSTRNQPLAPDWLEIFAVMKSDMPTSFAVHIFR